MRILIGFDGSATARAAADEALRFPWPAGASVRAVVALGGIEGPPPLRAAVRDALRNQAAWIEDRLRKRWPAARAVLAPEAPAEALLAEATRQDADLVVLGWRGHGPIRRLLMGSVSRKVAREARTAVMIVRGARAQAQDAKRFVLGYDGSRNARRAVRFLAKLEPPPGARALLFTSLPPLYTPPLTRIPPKARALMMAGMRDAERKREKRARAGLERAASLLRRRGWSVETRLTPQAPLLSLLEAADRFGADALVVGARSIGGLERALLGSVANGALERSRRPVIVVR